MPKTFPPHRARPLHPHPALASLCLLLLLANTAPAEPAAVHLDFARTNGTLRPVHGVNLGPLCYRGTVDLTEAHRQLRIPSTRLHDVVWVNAEAVDVHTVFPDFRDDPEDPASYRFGPTDDYLRGVTNTGSGIVYRLGESIEHTPRTHFAHPPADPARWAAICSGIVRHYNHGWANGLQLGIRYWEIWNEPDVRPQMWSGTDDDYFQLYVVASKHLKARFPDIKIGGPALGNTGVLRGSSLEPTPFFARFLDHCRAHDAPLDFFSWHCYTTNPWELARRARAVRQFLDAQGFAASESHLNEWNYLPDNDWAPMLRGGQGSRRTAWFDRIGGPEGAAFATTTLLLLQDAPLDLANYYTADVQGFGLFDLHGSPRKTFHAFHAFRQLLDTPVRVAHSNSDNHPVTLAAGLAHNRSHARILLTARSENPGPFALTVQNLPWPDPTRCTLQVLNSQLNLEIARSFPATNATPIALPELLPHTVLLLNLSPAGP